MRDPNVVDPPREPAGAVEELAQDAASRKRFLRMVGGAGAAGAFAVFLAACGGDDDESEPSGSNGADTSTGREGGGMGDLEIANYALTLEFLEADFYKQVVDSGEFDGDEAALIELIAQNEEEHVDALTALIEQAGGTPAEAPQTKFDDVLAGGRDMILETAAVVENVGAAAYLGQAGNIESKEVLAAALSIHTVEGRHAAVLNRIVGEPFVPDGAFAKPMDMDAVLEAVRPFIAS